MKMVGAVPPFGDDARTAPTGAPNPKPLGRLIGAFKTVSTKKINILRKTEGAVIWQRNYYEHIIRDEDSLNRIRQYIVDNPARWAFDRENPAVTAPEPENEWLASPNPSSKTLG